ncbi:MAG: replication protein RepA [DPANN group archaeon]|nr:replication protein RepA [DPANN group archaeon]
MPEDTELQVGDRKVIRRAPAIELPISEIKEGLGRISFIGTVINKNPDIQSFIVDFNNARVLVLTNDQHAFEAVKEGQTVRVFGKVMGTGSEIEILADFVQDFSKIDRELYAKVFYK